MELSYKKQPAAPRIDISLALNKWKMDVVLVDRESGQRTELKGLEIARVNDGTHMPTRDDLGFTLPQAERAMDLFSNPSEVWVIKGKPIQCRRNDRIIAARDKTPLVTNFIHDGNSYNVLVTKISE